jgi:hypothetical protein
MHIWICMYVCTYVYVHLLISDDCIYVFMYECRKTKYVELRHGEISYYDQGEAAQQIFEGEGYLYIHKYIHTYIQYFMLHFPWKPCLKFFQYQCIHTYIYTVYVCKSLLFFHAGVRMRSTNSFGNLRYRINVVWVNIHVCMYVCMYVCVHIIKVLFRKLPLSSLYLYVL